MWIVVARIAPEPIDPNVAVSDFRSRATDPSAAQQQASLLDDPLPPVPTPVPAPVPAPVIQSPIQAYAASLVASEMPVQPVTPAEFRLRSNTGCQAPDSPLRLTDRRA